MKRVENLWLTTAGRRSVLLAIVWSAVLAVGALGVMDVTSPTLRAMIETSTAFVWLLATAVIWQAFRETGQLRLLGVLISLLIVGVVDLALAFTPAALDQSAPHSLIAAPPLAILVAGLFLLWAARIPRSRLVGNTLVLSFAGLAVGLLVACAAGLASWIWADPLVSPAGHERLVVIPLVASAVPLIAASALFMRESHTVGQGTGCFSAGTLLLAIGALKRAFVPATAGVVSQSPCFRFAAFGTITLCGIHLLAARREELRRAAAASERQRLARDLHDGLCQDLAFIASNATRALGDSGSEPIVYAARRALAVSRGMLVDLSASSGSDLQTALRDVADELSQRFGIAVGLDVPSVEMSLDDREHLMRIVREAIVNAAVHGRAHNVQVHLERGDAGALVLSITDDGSGTTAGNWREGFGITNMRQHATMLGGRLSARSGPEGGSEVEVVLP